MYVILGNTEKFVPEDRFRMANTSLWSPTQHCADHFAVAIRLIQY